MRLLQGVNSQSLAMIEMCIGLTALVDNAYINGLDFDPAGNLITTW